GDVEFGGAAAARDDVEVDAHAPGGGQVTVAPGEGDDEVAVFAGDARVDLEVVEGAAVLGARGALGGVGEGPVEGLLVELPAHGCVDGDTVGELRHARAPRRGRGRGGRCRRTRRWRWGRTGRGPG